MNKREFLAQLEQRLMAVTPDERVAAMQYYSEYFDDAGPEHEQTVIQELGSPEKVAADILGTTDWSPPERTGETKPDSASSPPQASNGFNTQQAGAAAKAVKLENSSGNTQENANLSLAKLLLIIAICFFLLPFAFALLATAFSFLISFAILLTTPCILGIGLGVAGICITIVASFLIPITLGNALFSIGAGIFLIALSIVSFYAGLYLFTKFIPKLYRALKKFTKSAINSFNAWRKTP